jgi:leucyl-tRNA synthetase
VQVNGKVRTRLTVAAETSDDRLRDLALADPHVQKHLDGRVVRKIVIAPGATRLVSIVAG